MSGKLKAFMKRRWRTCVVLGLVGSVLLALVGYALWPPPVIGPPIRVVYWSWHSQSPGGGPLHYETSAFEIDLERGRWRRLSISGKLPEPTALDVEALVLGKLRSRSWQMMDQEHYQKTRAATEAWIACKPPKRLGYFEQATEGGGTGRLLITGPDLKLTTDLVSGGFRFRDPASKLCNELLIAAQH